MRDARRTSHAEDRPNVATEVVPWGGRFNGPSRDILEGFFATIASSITAKFETWNIVDSGTHVVWTGTTRGHVNANQAPFAAAEVHLWGVHEGRVVSLEVFVDHPTLQEAFPS